MANDKSNQQFWFNVTTRSVEHGPKSLALDRLGPFLTEADALRAEEIVRERAQKIAADEEAESEWPGN